MKIKLKKQKRKKTKNNGLNLHVPLFINLHTLLFHKIIAAKRENNPSANRPKSIPPKKEKSKNKNHAYICIKCYYLTQYAGEGLTA